MRRIEPKLNMCQIQDALVEAVNSALARWSHRPASRWQLGGGHADRSIYAAKRKARAALAQWEFTPAQCDLIIREAMEMAELERNAQD